MHFSYILQLLGGTHVHYINITTLLVSQLVFFTERVINIWNKLPTPTVDFKIVFSFKKTISNISLAELIGPRKVSRYDLSAVSSS